MEQQQLKNTIEAVLMSAEKPLKVNEIEALFAGDNDMPSRDEIRKSLKELGEDYENRGFELKEVSSGFRIQVRQDYSDWVGRLWEEKPARYTRALLETIALIAYRQPITRGEIEEVRGVSVSSNIIKTLMEREWIKVLGHKDVPGKPALYGTTKEFLDYFNLKSLEDLPSLAEIKDLDQIHQELDLDIDNTDTTGENSKDESTDADRDTGSEEADEAREEADEATDVTTVPATADNDASFEEEGDAELSYAEAGSEEGTDDSDLNTVATEADDAESVSGAQHSESSDTENGSEEADEDPAINSVAMEADDDGSVEEDDFAESEPRAQSVAG
jgi:segregation and condensation protein B